MTSLYHRVRSSESYLIMPQVNLLPLLLPPHPPHTPSLCNGNTGTCWRWDLFSLTPGPLASSKVRRWATRRVWETFHHVLKTLPPPGESMAFALPGEEGRRGLRSCSIRCPVVHGAAPLHSISTYKTYLAAMFSWPFIGLCLAKVRYMAWYGLIQHGTARVGIKSTQILGKTSKNAAQKQKQAKKKCFLILFV